MPNQRIQQHGINEPDMSTTTAVAMDIEDLPQLFVEAIDKAAGISNTAGLIGIGPGTAENLRRGRRRSIPVKLHEKIRKAVIRVLGKKRRDLDAIIHLALQSGVRADDSRIFAAAAALRRVEELLKEAAE